MFDLPRFQSGIIISISIWYILQGRVDDNIDTIKKRLKVFAALNLPVVKYYMEKGKLYKVFIGCVMNSNLYLDHAFKFFFQVIPVTCIQIYTLTETISQINAVGSVDEIYKQVYPVFASFDLRYLVSVSTFSAQFSFPHGFAI